MLFNSSVVRIEYRTTAEGFTAYVPGLGVIVGTDIWDARRLVRDKLIAANSDAWPMEWLVDGEGGMKEWLV